MEESSYTDATLQQRILQLEQERDELRLDVEQLCMQHSGISTKVDISSQIQARRITSLEQEMELWKKRLEACTRQNQKLQDELSEVKHIKAHFADLLESETDKNLELDKEIIFFQTKAANALVERDRALFQVDKCLEEEEELIATVHQLQNRVELLMSDLFEQKKRFQDLQENTKAELEDSKRLQNVVQFFWGIRSKLCEYEQVEGLSDRAAILLHDSESSWAFGDTTEELERSSRQVKESGAAMAALQEETCAANELVVRLQRQLEGETVLKQQAQEHCLLLKQKLLHLTVTIEGKLRTIHSFMIGLKEEIRTTLKEEEKYAELLLSAWLSQTTHNDPKSQTNKQLSTSIHVLTRNCTECEITEVSDDSEAFNEACISKENIISSKYSLGQDFDSEIRDTKEALALALQDKVAVLLLLSQQEERHIFQENMVATRESKITELQKQLVQVTIDKGKALRQVADLTEELAKAKDKQCANNQVLAATWNRGRFQNSLDDMYAHNSDERNVPSRWPLKSWFKGFDHFGSRFGAPAFFGTRMKGHDFSLATRLQAENASLWDMLSRFQKLCISVNHLYQIVIQVREQRPSEYVDAGPKATEKLDIVIAEAHRLILAFGVPVNYSGGRSYAEISTEEIGNMDSHLVDAERVGANEVVSFCGRLSLECILVAAEVYRTCLSEHSTCASSSHTGLSY